METLFGLPEKVVFCKKCVTSNQRPRTAIEHKNTTKFQTLIGFDEDGVCSSCRYHERKYNEIDWEAREKQLLELLDRHRSKDGSYDVIVPGSGGKDSMYVSHVLRTKYGMHPLTVTWPPNLYTDIGRLNFDAWLESGADNVCFTPNRNVHRRLTRRAFLNLLHPFQPFILGQKQVGPKVAMQYGIKLVMYGENPGEASKQGSPVMPNAFYAVPRSERTDIRIGGQHHDELLEQGFDRSDLQPYLPCAVEDVDAAGIEVHHMGFYQLWRPQDMFYYASENCGFVPNPERTEGTYTKFSSIDDKLDNFHFYTAYTKFGLGRCSYEASWEIRNHHITREEAVALVRRYDGEFPRKYFADVLGYLDLDEDAFWQAIDRFRSPHLWNRENGEWKLRHRVFDEA